MESMNEVYGNGLALFQTRDTDTGIQGTEWISYRPVNQMGTEGTALEFSIPPMATTYLDLKKCLLRLKVKITRADGSPIKGYMIDRDTPIRDFVALTNAPLHSIFSQVDLFVQQQPLSQVGAYYPYKAYVDLLLNTEDDGVLNSQLFIKDDGGTMDDTSPDGSNNALYIRSLYTNRGNSVDLIGRLELDLFQQDRLLLNGLPVNLKLWQNRDPFRLMAKDDTEQYKLKIEDASLQVSSVRVNPGVLLGHDAILKEGTNALYPYSRSVIKMFGVSQGQFAFSEDNVFQGEVPSRLIVGLVSSSAVSGDYTRNPYNFQTFHCNKVGFYLNGQSVPSHPLEPNYEANQFVEAYHTLNKEGKRRAVDIGRSDYKGGYCLYVIDPLGDYRQNTLPQRGHTRLELNFGTALPEACTVVVYAKFPALMKVDSSRKVSLE